MRSVAESRFEIGSIGVLPDINPIVASIIAGEPAERAGLKAGDIVLAVNGQQVVTRTQLIEAISRNGGREIELTIQRDGQQQRIKATPAQRGDRGMLGVYVTEPTRSFKPGPIEAIQLSVQRNIEFSGLIFRTIGGLFVGENIAATAHGSGSHRAVVGRIGAGRLDCALYTDGGDQPEPGAPQPAADSHPRRRATS